MRGNSLAGRVARHGGRMSKTLAGALVALALMLPAAASADVIQRGYVVRIEAGEIYFDIGQATGVTMGAPVRFKRPVTLKHPVSGKEIVDELPLGELAVLSVGETLSMTGPTTSLSET